LFAARVRQAFKSGLESVSAAQSAGGDDIGLYRRRNRQEQDHDGKHGSAH
jgi:hypothetical protein